MIDTIPKGGAGLSMEENETKIEDTTSKESKNKRKFLMQRQIRYTIATTIVLLLLLGFSAVFVLRVYFMTESACYDDLVLETEDAIADLEENLRSDRTTLRIIADLIGNSNETDSIEASGYLSNYDVNNQITHISMLLPNNEVITANGRRANIGEDLDFDTESVLSEHISGTTLTVINTSTPVIHNYVPIRSNGICIGLLFSTASSSNIAKAWMPSLYDKKGYYYVVDRKTGKVIINSSTDGVTDIHDISFKQTDPSYTKDDTIGNILDGRKGYSVFRSEMSSEKLYMCYLPFGIEDWEMVVLVPESEVFSAVSPIRTGLYLLLAASVIVILIYAIWLFHEIHAAILETEEKANIDVLTGLRNRNLYEAYLKKLEGSKDNIICIFVDVNGLHDINNTKGHSAGDQMLRFTADTLKVQFGDDHIYRIGGDEFVLFRKDKTYTEIKECLDNFHETLRRNDYHAAVGTSDLKNGISIEQLVENAEKNMYESKQTYYDQLGKEMRV